MLDSKKPRKKKTPESETGAAKPPVRKRAPRKKSDVLASAGPDAEARTSPSGAADAAHVGASEASFAVREGIAPAARVSPAPRSSVYETAAPSSGTAAASHARPSVAAPHAAASSTQDLSSRRSTQSGAQEMGESAKSRRGHGWVTSEERHRLISLKAYAIAERRGFRNGHPEQDWLEAEAEIDAMLLKVQESWAE